MKTDTTNHSLFPLKKLLIEFRMAACTAMGANTSAASRRGSQGGSGNVPRESRVAYRRRRRCLCSGPVGVSAHD